MSSPREKDTTDQDDDEKPGRLRPPRPTDTNENDLPGESSSRSRMDHDSKQCGSLPPLLRGSPAQTDVRETDVRAASSTALAPDRRLLMRIVRGNDSSAENPAEHGLASTGPKRKNRSNHSGRRRCRAETALAAGEICRKKRKIPAPRLAGQGFFEACQSAEEPRRSSVAPPERGNDSAEN
jgi:hypothetical protein